MDIVQDSPHLCECGCGKPTSIAKRTQARTGTLKGQPFRFLRGHTPGSPHAEPYSGPPKLCECGCGEFTPLAKRNEYREGYVKGQPRRLIPGHRVKGAVTQPLEERFWSKVDKSGGPAACWPWTASVDPKGYGQFAYADGTRRSGRAHRVAWILANGPISAGMSVCHSCDNPPCCNPAHLWLGTNADNVADRVRKGRSSG